MSDTIRLLGQLEKIDDLRDIWKHEALHFSKWLSEVENLEQLSNAVGIQISLLQRESPVGDFSVDILAVEEGTERKIIIENQLEDTNHDHLGKIITYAAGCDAKVVIWIVKRARDEHRQAVEWLNQHTNETVGFFLLEIQLWKIGNSLPAPYFNLISSPNFWAKELNPDRTSETQIFQLNFWQKFVDYASAKPDSAKPFTFPKPKPRNWYDLSVGKSVYTLRLTVSTQNQQVGAAIYINDDKELFANFEAQKESIKKSIGEEIKWTEAKKQCGIVVHKPFDVMDEQTWPAIFDWLCGMSLKLKNIVNQYDE